MPAEPKIYVNSDTGNDDFDGTSPVDEGNNVGPKKHLTGTKGACEAAEAGYVIQMADGTYDEESATIVTSAVKPLNFVGESQSATIIKTPTGVSRTVMSLGPRSTVRDLKIEYAGTPSTSLYGIDVPDTGVSDPILLERVTIDAPGITGARLVPAGPVMVRNCSITAGVHGVMFRKLIMRNSSVNVNSLVGGISGGLTAFQVSGCSAIVNDCLIHVYGNGSVNHGIYAILSQGYLRVHQCENPATAGIYVSDGGSATAISIAPVTGEFKADFSDSTLHADDLDLFVGAGGTVTFADVTPTNELAHDVDDDGTFTDLTPPPV